MAKRKYGNKLPPFVPLTWEMLNSKAYKELRYASAKALPYFLGRFKGSYHDPQRFLFEFHFSYSEGRRLRFAYSTFSKIIQELVRKGFIDPLDKGGLRSDGKSYNMFSLSSRWIDYGNNNFKQIEWKCFQPRAKLKTTSKKEINSFKKGNKTASEEASISQSME